jgi:hypothetical protein
MPANGELEPPTVSTQGRSTAATDAIFCDPPWLSLPRQILLIDVLQQTVNPVVGGLNAVLAQEGVGFVQPRSHRNRIRAIGAHNGQLLLQEALAPESTSALKKTSTEHKIAPSRVFQPLKRSSQFGYGAQRRCSRVENRYLRGCGLCSFVF